MRMQHSSLGRVAAATSFTLAVVMAAATAPAAAGPETSAQEPELLVQATPDPSPDGATTVYVGSTPDELDAPPTVTVKGEKGRPRTVRAEAITGTTWYVAELSGLAAGAYDVTAKGALDGDAQTGSTTFEVTGPSAGRWAAAGPYDIGGQLTVAPSEPDRAVVAMADSPNLWLTDDAGRTWTDLDLPVVSSPDQPAVVVDRNDPDEWWYGTFDKATERTYLLHTTDAGATWTLELEVAERFVSLAASTQTEAPALVTADTTHVSTNDGRTWEAHALGLERYVTGASFNGTDLLVAAGPTLWRYDDEATGAWPEPVAAYTSDPAGGGIVNTLVADDTAIAMIDIARGVVVSTDGGTTWELRGSHTGALYLSDGVLMARSGLGWYLSENLGATWRDLSKPVAGIAPQDFDVWSDRTMTISTSAGMFRARLDGSSYDRIGVPGRIVSDVAVSGDKLLAATTNGAYASDLPVDDLDWGGADGEGRVGSGIADLAVDPSRPGVVWGTSRTAFGLAIRHTRDNGETWEETGNRGGTPTAIAVHPVTGDVMASFTDNMDGDGILFSGDDGATWTSTLHGTYFTAVAGDPDKAGVWWLGNDDGLWRTDDDGATITKVSDLVAPEILFTEDGSLVVGGRGIHISHNDGRTFQSSDIVSAPVLVSDLTEVDGRLYASTTPHFQDGFFKGGRGVYTSSNGATWTSLSGGLPTLDVNALAASPDGSTLYAGTPEGVYATPLG